jgi:hypothetical protein
MILDVWCSFYAKNDILIGYFGELIQCLKQQTSAPRAYIFAIHGPYYKEAIDKLKLAKLNAPVYVTESEQNRLQYEGFKRILRVYGTISNPDIVATIDGDDILVKTFIENTRASYSLAAKYKFKAVVRNILRFYNDDITDIEDKDDIESFYIPNALSKGFINPVNGSDDELYQVNTPFTINEETSTLVIDYTVMEQYLLSMDKVTLREDVKLYQYLCSNKLVALVPVIVMFYRQHVYQSTETVKNENE